MLERDTVGAFSLFCVFSWETFQQGSWRRREKVDRMRRKDFAPGRVDPFPVPTVGKKERAGDAIPWQNTCLVYTGPFVLSQHGKRKKVVLTEVMKEK